MDPLYNTVTYIPQRPNYQASAINLDWLDQLPIEHTTGRTMPDGLQLSCCYLKGTMLRCPTSSYAGNMYNLPPRKENQFVSGGSFVPASDANAISFLPQTWMKRFFDDGIDLAHHGALPLNPFQTGPSASISCLDWGCKIYADDRVKEIFDQHFGKSACFYSAEYEVDCTDMVNAVKKYAGKHRKSYTLYSDNINSFAINETKF